MMIRLNKRILVALGLLGAILVILTIAAPVWVIEKGRESVVAFNGPPLTGKPAIIVFGAGLTRGGKPSHALEDRLLTAEEIYRNSKNVKILVSGDNRFANYDEPTAMRTFLVERGVPEEDVVADYAGRRTYDTCARASEIWGIDSAMLISQGFHLPRAIYLCEHQGIDSTGASATKRRYLNEARWKVREIMAIYRALIDVHVLPPSYVGGETLDDFKDLR